MEEPGAEEKRAWGSHSPGNRGTRPKTKQDRSPRTARGQSRACSGREHRKSAGQQETHVGEKSTRAAAEGKRGTRLLACDSGHFILGFGRTPAPACPRGVFLVSFARFHLPAVLLWLAFAARAGALTIALDFSYDAPHGNYLQTHAAALDALNRAAADLDHAITMSLTAVTASSFSGTSNGTTTTFNWTLNVTNPSNGQTVPQQPFTVPADTVTMHVGLRTISGNAPSAPQADLASPAVSVTGGTGGIVNATAMAQQSSNAMLLRGGAPVIGSKSGQIGGASGASYALQFGPFGGSLAFNGQVVNNVPDEQSLNAYWQFDASQPVAAGKYDFYTVALRSMVTALGFGASDAWKAQADGSNWKGLAGRYAAPERRVESHHHRRRDRGRAARAESLRRQLGAGCDVGWLQPGERRYLTTLDVAFLQDIGYQVVPEPSGVWLVAVGAIVLGGARRARFRLV